MLDDYHLITHPTIRQVMATLVRHLPDTLRLLLITRMDPTLPLLTRRRAQQQLLEVRAADLRLATEEARAVLTQTTGGDVDKATVALLEEQTEGWAIGLQLAGLSLREQEDPAAFVRTFQTRHHRLIMDFLLDEVLDRQSGPVLDFLLETAVLVRVCDSLCATVVGERADGGWPLLAEPGGYLRIFVELGADMADLLAQLAARGVAPDYIGHILAAFPAAPAPEPEALTGRELQILALLQQGLSDKEIAERLFLSVLTVKKHNRNIYRKLGASGRRSAITTAEMLNLIP